MTLTNTTLFGVSADLALTTIPPLRLSQTFADAGYAPDVAAAANPPPDTLRIDWNVSKTIGTSADECQVTIYNLDLTWRKAVEGIRRSGQGARALTTRLVLNIGWGGIPEPMFLGEVTWFEAGRQQDADILTTITALAGGVAYAAPVAGGSDFGLAASAILIVEAAKMGVTVTPAVLAIVEAEASARAITAWTRPDDMGPRSLLNWMMATLELTWSVDPLINSIVVYKHGIRADLPIVLLGPTTGLISYTPEDDGISFEALAQPRVVPGGQVQLTEGQFELPAGAPMRVESVEFSGSTYGQSLMRGRCKPIKTVGGIV